MNYNQFMKLIFALLTSILVSCELTKSHTVIGIYTQILDSYKAPSEDYNKKASVSHNSSFIASSYVKYIQMSGARVIPLFAFRDRSYFDEILPKINGVLFPGGDMDINIDNQWTQNSEYIMKYAMNQTKKGNSFPIWGTCQGLQQMAYLTSGYDLSAIASVQGQVDVRNTLQIQPNNTFFKDFPQELLNSLESGEGVVYFNHHFAVTREYFNNNVLLQEFWNIEAFTTSSFNETFISTFKAKQYPFYAIQFHPEKNCYEWKVNADRQQHAIQIVQILSNQFVQIARKNTNKFANNEQLIKQSIFNYKAQQTEMNYITVYIFNEEVIPNNLQLPNKRHLLRIK